MIPRLFSADPLGDMIQSFQDPSFRVSGSLISSLTIMLIVAVLAIIVGILANRQDPMKPSKGLLGLVEHFVDYLENWTKGIMGREPGNWPGYFLCLFIYLFLAFVWSITGFPSVIDYLVMPLTFSIVMFVLIQVTALRHQKLGYFHRYIEPVPIFLPINLVTMWTPIISTSLRMFGNCLAGSVVIGLVNWGMKNISIAVFSSWAAQFEDPLNSPAAIWFGAIPIGILNLYFSLFSAYIQTLVFASLNGVWIGQEMPESSPMGKTSQALRENGDKNTAIL